MTNNKHYQKLLKLYKKDEWKFRKEQCDTRLKKKSLDKLNNRLQVREERRSEPEGSLVEITYSEVGGYHI